MAYALYFSTSSPEDALHSVWSFTFNVDFDGAATLWTLLPATIPFTAPSITALIVEELDDGLAFNPATDLSRLQLIGTTSR